MKLAITIFSAISFFYSLGFALCYAIAKGRIDEVYGFPIMFILFPGSIIAAIVSLIWYRQSAALYSSLAALAIMALLFGYFYRKG